MERVIIVGGGQAAGQAGASLRQEGYEGEIMILTEESYFPYQRPPLSKQFLAGEQGIERVYLRPEKFYTDNRIEVLTQHRVESLDIAAQRLAIANGAAFDFSHLLLATGSRVRRLDNIPGGELVGVAYLRTLDDAQSLKSLLSEAANVVVLGGGYIGLEVASVVRDAGLSVTVLEMQPRILSRVATASLSGFYQKLHEERGVIIKTDTQAKGFKGAADHVEGVILADDSVLPADVVVVGVGIQPNVELAAAAGIVCENGIVVDQRCRTSHPNVFAVGDCTHHPNPYAGQTIRLESVPNAMEQARVAAALIVGKEKIYDAEPWFWSDQYDVKLQMVGFTLGADQTVIRGDMTQGAGIHFYLKDGVVIGAEAINSVREFLTCRKLVAGRLRPDPAQLADLDTPLKDLLG